MVASQATPRVRALVLISPCLSTVMWRNCFVKLTKKYVDYSSVFYNCQSLTSKYLISIFSSLEILIAKIISSFKYPYKGYYCESFLSNPKQGNSL